MITVTLIAKSFPAVRKILNPNATCLAQELQRHHFIRPICGFSGNCGKCAIKFPEALYQGIEKVSPRSDEELILLSKLGQDTERVRLSCQLAVKILPRNSEIVIEQPEM